MSMFTSIMVIFQSSNLDFRHAEILESTLMIFYHLVKDFGQLLGLFIKDMIKD